MTLCSCARSTLVVAGLACASVTQTLAQSGTPYGGMPGAPPKARRPSDRPFIFPVAKIASPTGVASDRFGASVALLGDTLFVGSPGDDSAGEDVGAVYLYGWDGQGWNPQGVLVPQAPQAGQAFGAHIAVEPDQPDLMFVGAGSDDSANPDAGAVYVLERNAQGDWVETQKLTGSDVSAGAGFGLTSDVHGSTLVVGAPFESNSIGGVVGNAYVFERDTDGTWQETAKLFPSVAPSGAIFGSAVSTDGERILVGAPYLGLQFIPGEAFVFARTSSGWQEEAMLRRPNSVGRDRFGRSAVLVNGRAYVGAPADGPPAIGTLATFKRVGDGQQATWDNIDFRTADDAESFDRFANQMAYGAGRLAVAAPTRSNDPSIYLFDARTRTPKLLTKIVRTDRAQDNAFGDAVAISSTAVAVGAPFDNDVASAAGAVYLYEIITGDVDGDGLVTPRDLRIIIRALGTCEGDADYVRAADLDRSGCVTLDDLLILLSLWH